MTSIRPADDGRTAILPQAAAQTGAATTVLDRLRAAAASYPDRPAMRFLGRRTTYHEFARQVDDRALVLRRSGIGPATRVGLLLPQCPAILLYMFAAHAAGASVVLLDPETGDDDLAGEVRRSKLSALVTCDLSDLHARAMALAGTALSGTTLTGMGLAAPVLVVPFAAQLPFSAATRMRLFQAHRFARTPAASAGQVMTERDALVAARSDPSARGVAAPMPAGPGDVAMLCEPAPGAPQHRAELTHAALAANLDQILMALPALTPGRENILAALPLQIPIALQIAANVAVARAAELIIPASLTAEGLAMALHAGPPSVVMATPPMLGAITSSDRLRAAALKPARLVLVAGGTASKQLHATIAAATAASLFQSYAVPHAGAYAAITACGNEPRAGLCLPGTKAVVRDLADGAREVARGERGEVCVAGPQFAGSATGERFLRTGDLGSIDQGGRLVIIDRVEDLIVAAGYLIYPSRIEDALLEHPGVAEASVIGVADDKRGSAPKAFVVLKRGVTTTERDLRQYLEIRISKIEIPADIVFPTRLPRTAFGLVCKASLRRQQAARR